MASEFIKQLEIEVPVFLEAVEATLPFVAQYYADHVCWRTESEQEYDELIASLKNYSGASLLIESIIGGRPIATFKLHDGIMCCSNRRNVTVLEIPSPKQGSPYQRGLEHIEFVIGDGREGISPINDTYHQSTLQSFIDDHDDIKSWNVKAMNKEINPDVSFRVDLGFRKCSVKFHLLPLECVVRYEIAHGMM